MNRPLFLCLIFALGVQAQSPSLLDRINAPDKIVPSISQTLTGTWMLELRPAGVPIVAPAIVTYLAEGTAVGPTSDGNHSNSQGVWVRVGDRKFIQTMFIFLFDEKRVMSGMQKVRIAVNLSADGATIQGSVDRLLLDREGKETAIFTGGSFRGVRLAPEKTSDFDSFLKEN